MNTPKRAALYTLGCRLNQAETSTIQGRLESAGYTIVPFGEASDLAVVNTCTVTHEADAKSRKAIRGYIRRNPLAYLAVVGCYAQLGAESIAEIEGVDLIVGNQEKLNLLDYVAEGKNARPLVVRDRMDADDFTISLTATPSSAHRPNLKIQDGCDFMCTFCVIPFARGRARSRELENLLDEARLLADQGAKEIVLTGVNIGTYRHSGKTILDVIDELDGIAGLERIRISSIEPTTTSDELWSRMASADHALVPHLHLPLQSGSDRVLKLMGRKYSAVEYLDFIEGAASSVPGLCIGTDILVGTPGEEESDFEQTCALLKESPIAYAHVFKYSARKGTAAMRLQGAVTPEVKSRRSARIRKIAAQKWARFQQQHEGNTLEVLFEEEVHGRWLGYTGNYIRVACASDAILTNRLISVVLGEARGEFAAGRCVPTAEGVAVL